MEPNSLKNCIRCKDDSIETRFHEIFDETGEELELVKYLEIHFQIKVQPCAREEERKLQVLCEDCMDILIEMIDLVELREKTTNSHVEYALEEEVHVNDSSDVDEKDVKILDDSNGNTFIQLNQSSDNVNEANINIVILNNEDGFEYRVENARNPEEHDLQSSNADGTNFKNKKQLTIGSAAVEEYSEYNAASDLEETINHDILPEGNIIEQHIIIADENTEYVVTDEPQEVYDSDIEEIIESTASPNYTVIEFDSNDPSKQDYIEFETDKIETTVELKTDMDGFVFETECKDKLDEPIDLNDYHNTCLSTKIEDLKFEWHNVCKLCFQDTTTFQGLLEHIQLEHVDDSILLCNFLNCEEAFTELHLLAKHLIFQHCEVLSSLPIYGICPHCGWRFNNYVKFNKHSCCRTIKRRNGIKTCCKHCDKQFASFRRFNFHMQFHLANRRPKACLICGEAFFNDEKFFEHVTYDHEGPDGWACRMCDLQFISQATFESHQKCHSTSRKYKCDLCPRKYDREQMLIHHKKTAHNSGEKKSHECTYCGKILANAYNLTRHMTTHQPDAEVEASYCVRCGLVDHDVEDLLPHTEMKEIACCGADIVTEIISCVYCCENCSLEFKDKNYLMAHRSTPEHNDAAYKCSICGNVFDRHKKLLHHFKTHANYDARYISLPYTRLLMCNMEDCTATYKDWPELAHHKRKNHTAFPCTNCKTTVYNIEAYEKHRVICDKTHEFICPFCHKECKSKMSLSVHIVRAHNNTNVTCEFCTISLKDQEAMDKHVDFIHTPVDCPFCHRTIKNKRIYKTHLINVHERVQRYFCDTCNKGFYYKSERDSHVKHVHTDTVYCCSDCDFTTNYRESMDIHIKTHNSNLPFECPICNRRFGRKHVLNVHVKRHNKNREYLCSDYLENGCRESFVTISILKRHILTAHEKGKQKTSTRKRKANSLPDNISESDDNPFPKIFMRNKQTNEIIDLPDPKRMQLTEIDTDFLAEDDTHLTNDSNISSTLTEDLLAAASIQIDSAENDNKQDGDDHDEDENIDGDLFTVNGKKYSIAVQDNPNTAKVSSYNNNEANYDEHIDENDSVGMKFDFQMDEAKSDNANDMVSLSEFY